MIQRVAVVGAGTMGRGIAQLCAQSGFSVKVSDSVPAALEALPKLLRQGLDAAVLKGKLTTAQAERAVFAVKAEPKLEGLAGADIVIEAASEDLEIKRVIFRRLGEIDPTTILATNTSSLPVHVIAEAVSDPGRVLGLHFFNPPVAMKLVEMVRTPQTRPEVFQEAWDFVLSGLRRTPVDVRDTPGFIVNRVMRPYYLEAQRLAADGAGIAQTDAACRELGGLPMGPFELMDLIGLDVNLAITKTLYDSLGRPARLKPQPLQEKLVAGAGLGLKTGRGFYDYSGKDRRVSQAAAALVPAPGKVGADQTWARIREALVAEAQAAFDEEVASRGDIDLAVKLAMNFPKGPFEWQKESIGRA